MFSARPSRGIISPALNQDEMQEDVNADVVMQALRFPQKVCDHLIAEASRAAEVTVSFGRKACALFGTKEIIHAFAVAMTDSLLIFAFLFMGASLHKVGCPEEVSRYSLKQWVEKGGSETIYKMLAIRNPRAMWFSIAAYVFGAALLIYSLGSKLAAIVRSI